MLFDGTEHCQYQTRAAVSLRGRASRAATSTVSRGRFSGCQSVDGALTMPAPYRHRLSGPSFSSHFRFSLSTARGGSGGRRGSRPPSAAGRAHTASLSGIHLQRHPLRVVHTLPSPDGTVLLRGRRPVLRGSQRRFSGPPIRPLLIKLPCQWQIGVFLVDLARPRLPSTLAAGNARGHPHPFRPSRLGGPSRRGGFVFFR